MFTTLNYEHVSVFAKPSTFLNTSSNIKKRKKKYFFMSFFLSIANSQRQPEFFEIQFCLCVSEVGFFMVSLSLCKTTNNNNNCVVERRALQTRMKTSRTKFWEKLEKTLSDADAKKSAPTNTQVTALSMHCTLVHGDIYTQGKSVHCSKQIMQRI